MPLTRTSLLPLALLLFFAVSCGSLKLAGVSRDAYVGSATCISCHEKSHPGIVRAWRGSRHHATLRPVGEHGTVAVIGRQSGRHVRLRSDLGILPSDGWEADEDENPPPHNVIAVDGGSVDAGRQCLGCHTTGYFVAHREFAEPGVGCEACHGPGRTHAESRGAKKAIVNPAGLSPSRNRMVCGQCHSLGRDRSAAHPFPVMRRWSKLEPFQPGQNLARGFVDARPKLVRKGWEYSLFVQGVERYARQLCTDCHDPHGRPGHPAMLEDPTNEICFRCHGIGRARLRYENHFGLGDATKRPCWQCHRNAHAH